MLIAQESLNWLESDSNISDDSAYQNTLQQVWLSNESKEPLSNRQDKNIIWQQVRVCFFSAYLYF